MRKITTVAEIREFHGCELVPTMGALHEGHSTLIHKAMGRNNEVVVSIFVNPRQFGPGEDLEKYPRTLEKDLDLCRELGVSAVFAPPVEEMYPPGFGTHVEVEKLSRILCGRNRPGHFRGVTTVVARLFGLFKPKRAYFGWKDAQQVFIIRRMVLDLAMDVEVVGVETIRHPDGLAFSSRNRYLSPDARSIAPELSRSLKTAANSIREGADIAETTSVATSLLESNGFEVDYVEVRDTIHLEAFTGRWLASAASPPVIIFGAAVIDGTRLIDNFPIEVER